ncbi:hypothetical protein [Chondromyces crocatus]|uniref:PGRS family protein n=1 Tax=Chondromyces crocatus TaxID=52 RepID=A0A0K1ECK9_CHOCO|nr:hypothetical protein [Chondromyces crocatus]AKT38601.1 uncharacterized protein CMC5_027480 [Chondromyces crocatus]
MTISRRKFGGRLGEEGRGAVLGLVALAAVVTAGLGVGCAEGTVTPPPNGDSSSGGEGGDKPTYGGCIPSESAIPVANDCGVWASSSQGHDGNAGIKAGPVKSLAEAFSRALDPDKGTGRVYACAEPFQEAVEVPPGITLYGGLDCEAEWGFVGDQRKTTIAGPPDRVAMRLLPGEAASRIEDVLVQAANGETPGASSIAVLAHQASAELVRCELVAGDGAVGATGEHGAVPAMPGDPPPTAQAGLPGVAGTRPCLTVSGTLVLTTAGGPPVELVCDDGATSLGGKGGDGLANSGQSGQSGQTGDAGPGGTGAQANETTWTCTAGRGLGGDGSTGLEGTVGAPAAGVGALSPELGFVGTSGVAGTVGRPGQGGGGGGAAYGGACGILPGAHGAGGSGGTGGCGGKPGQGGGPGGASFGLVSLDARVVLTESKITAGNGGLGGQGGDGQVGGPGGVGGAGGSFSSVNPMRSGCAGGVGGKGGDGGPGGGGLGGHAAAVAFSGTPLSLDESIPLTFGAAGPGGMGGTGAGDGAQGEGGLATRVLELPLAP